VSHETEQRIAKVQAQAEQEIASAAKTARQELKAYAAELALELAERKIRARLTPAADARLLNEFVSDVDRRGRRGTN
jgi:F0F1-type ATP synthase membrane subunit b/b'